MKERPILFSTPMVQAIREGHKTMTRRVIKPQPLGDIDANRNIYVSECPYGVPGYRLWVRESYCSGCINDKVICYKADCKPDLWPPCEGSIVKPSIFMPRWASRILLEITNIKVERVQEITPCDCVHEGLFNQLREYDAGIELRNQFHGLWDKINTKRGYSWDSNPWVWVIEFKVVNQ